MRKYLLGGLVTYLLTYSLGCTYIIMRGVKKNV